MFYLILGEVPCSLLLHNVDTDSIYIYVAGVQLIDDYQEGIGRDQRLKVKALSY